MSSKKSKSSKKKTSPRKDVYNIFDGSWRKISLSKDQFKKFKSRWKDYLKIDQKNNHIIVVISKGVEYPAALKKYINDNLA